MRIREKHRPFEAEEPEQQSLRTAGVGEARRANCQFGQSTELFFLGAEAVRKNKGKLEGGVGQAVSAASSLSPPCGLALPNAGVRLLLCLLRARCADSLRHAAFSAPSGCLWPGTEVTRVSDVQQAQAGAGSWLVGR